MAVPQQKTNRLVLTMVGTLVLLIALLMLITPSATGDDNAEIKGYVTERGTGDPIEGVEVDLWGDGFNTTYTDIFGYYEMNVADGDWHVHMEKENHTSHDNDITINPDDTIWYNMTLAEKNAMIKGYVTDDDSRGAIEDAYINLWDESNEVSEYTSTDSSGYYELMVAASYYMLWAGAEDHSQYSTEFEIEEDETLWINATLKFMNSWVKGYVTEDDSRSAIEDAEVGIWGMEGGNWSTTDSSGYYEVRVFQSDFNMMVTKSGYYSYDRDISLEKDQTKWYNVTLEEAPPETVLIKGYVEGNDSRSALQGANVHADVDGYNKDNQTDGNGYYELTVPSGYLRFNVNRNGYKEFNDEFTIYDNETIWINVTLEPKPPETATLKGYIYEDDSRGPMENVFVAAFGEYWNTTNTDDQGYYEMRLSPSEYHFMAQLEGYSEYHDSFEIHDWETLWMNGTITEETSIIKGYVTDNSRGPLFDARIELDNRDAQMHYTVWTDENGYYERTVVGGDWFVEANMMDYFSERDELQVGDYDEVWFNATLEAAEMVLVQGFITETDTGDPIEEEWIDFESDRFGENVMTDNQGYYEVMLAADITYDVRVDVEGFQRSDEEVFVDGDMWFNMSLDSVPPPDVFVRGYVSGYETRGPLQAMVGAMNIALDADTGTQSDEDTGYYEMDVWSGYGFIMSMAEDYHTHFQFTNFTEGEMWINITLYPHEEADSIISGYITDGETRSALEGAIVLLATEITGVPVGDDDMGFPYMDVTDDQGYYEIEVPGGDYYMLVQYEDDMGLVMEVTVADITVQNVELQPFMGELHMEAVFTDWDNAEFMNKGPWGMDSATGIVRIQVDFLVGNRDGVVSASEAEAFLGFLETMSEEDPEFDGESTEDDFFVDGIFYDFVVDGVFYEITGLEGNITSTEPVWNEMRGELESHTPIPGANEHTILVNTSYDNGDGEGAEELTLVLPANFVLRSFTATENVSVTGLDSDTVIIAFIGAPMEDAYEWVTLEAWIPSDVPIAEAGADILVNHQEVVQYSGTGTDTDGTITLYEWDFEGDGTFDYSSPTSGVTTYTFPATGIYESILRVTDDRGLVDTDNLTVIVNAIPMAVAGSNIVVNHQEAVQFNGTGTDIDGTIALYEWDFEGDGTFDYSSPTTGATTYTYPAAGTYVPVLKVTDDRGASDTDNLTVIVNAIPTVNAGVDITVIAGDQVDFLAVAVDTDGTIRDYTWDFDYDGATFVPTLVSPTGTANHTYTVVGNHTVYVKVIDNHGATNFDTLIVTVNEDPDVTVPGDANLQIDSMTISNLDPEDGDDVNVEVNLKNIGESTATNIKIKIFIDGVLKSSIDVENILANSSEIVDYTWTVEEGTHKITVNMTYSNGSDEIERSITVEAEEESGIPGFELMVLIAAIGIGLVLTQRPKD